MACALELSSDSDLITKEASVKKEEDLSPAASLVTLIAPVVLRYLSLVDIMLSISLVVLRYC